MLVWSQGTSEATGRNSNARLAPLALALAAAAALVSMLCCACALALRKRAVKGGVKKGREERGVKRRCRVCVDDLHEGRGSGGDEVRLARSMKMAVALRTASYLWPTPPVVQKDDFGEAYTREGAQEPVGRWGVEMTNAKDQKIE